MINDTKDLMMKIEHSSRRLSTLESENKYWPIKDCIKNLKRNLDKLDKKLDDAHYGYYLITSRDERSSLQYTQYFITDFIKLSDAQDKFQDIVSSHGIKYYDARLHKERACDWHTTLKEISEDVFVKWNSLLLYKVMRANFVQIDSSYKDLVIVEKIDAKIDEIREQLGINPLDVVERMDWDV